MGSTRHNKKRRSKTAKIKQPQRPKKPVNPLGNSTIAKNWNKKETMTQNYRRLGLVSRLQTATGGVELKIHEPAPPSHVLDLKRLKGLEEAVVTEARVERDADGRIVRVIRSGRSGRANPLNDPLNEFDSASEDEEKMEDEEEEEELPEWGGFQDDEDEDMKTTTTTTPLVRQLEEEASTEYEKKPRAQSDIELEWLRRLVARHGDDVEAMVRDKKLNPMQQTAGDIGRRLRRWKGRGLES